MVRGDKIVGYDAAGAAIKTLFQLNHPLVPGDTSGQSPLPKPSGDGPAR